MRRRPRPGTAALIALATAALTVTLATPASAHGRPFPQPSHGRTPTNLALTTKQPYQPQGDLRAYQRPPVGFTPVFTEDVSRHGARTLSDSDDGDALLTLWNAADAAHALTPLGRTLGPAISALLAANATVGYGLLTGSGISQLKQTAVRMQRRLPTLFASAAKGVHGTTGPTRIAVLAASQQRTVDSANDFVAGLESVNPKLAAVVGPTTTDDDLLYFHKAAVNADYQNYVKNDPRVAAAEKAARDLPQIAGAARDALLRSFRPSFVNDIADGKYADEFADEIDAADALYSLWAVTADMPAEGSWHFDRYLPQADANWFGYLDDVTSFYENGPAFAGDDITYRMADVLLDDMFAQLDAKRDGTSSLVAALRFTHAEEIFPLATLLQLPGSTKQLPAGTPFSYADDPFRGAQVAPMGANIQWDLFRRGNTYLVRMLYNEKQTAFKASCRPVQRGSYFYDLNELERCYGYTG